MDNSFTIKLQGCKDYMLAVELKKALGSHPILAYLLSLSVLFFSRDVRVCKNDKAMILNQNLFMRLTARNQERQVRVVNQNCVHLSAIEKNNTLFSRRSDFTMGDSDALSLVEGDIINILKNTKKDLTRNQLIIPDRETFNHQNIYSNRLRPMLAIP